MPSLARLLGLLVVGTALALFWLLWLTYRQMTPESLANHWTALLLSGQAPLGLVQSLWGNHPPQWVQGLAVAWRQTNLLAWWWLPLVLMALPWLAWRRARRRPPANPSGPRRGPRAGAG